MPDRNPTVSMTENFSVNITKNSMLIKKIRGF
jgi:hypothetical protein